MRAAKVWVMSVGLHPAGEARVVRAGDSGTAVTDGPFTEAKEHVGGFTIVRVNDREAAVAWAQKVARATTLPIEVREMRPGAID
jgi:hypothetical protein